MNTGRNRCRNFRETEMKFRQPTRLPPLTSLHTKGCTLSPKPRPSPHPHSGHLSESATLSGNAFSRLITLHRGKLHSPFSQSTVKETHLWIFQSANDHPTIQQTVTKFTTSLWQ